MMEIDKEAYEQGKQASGDIIKNPYPEQSRQGISWHEGWLDGFFGDSPNHHEEIRDWLANSIYASEETPAGFLPSEPHIAPDAGYTTDWGNE